MSLFRFLKEVQRLIKKKYGKLGAAIAYLLLDPAAPGSIPSIPQKNSEEKIINAAEVNQWCWLEESGRWLENVDQTYLLRSSGKPALQKKIMRCCVAWGKIN